MYSSLLSDIREVQQRLWRRQRQRRKTKTIALPVRFTFWYISLSSSVKQQREITTFKVLWRT